MGISANNEDWILRNLKYDAKWKCFTCAERSECWAFLSCYVRESRQRQHTWSTGQYQHWTLHGLSPWGPGPGYGQLNCDLNDVQLQNRSPSIPFYSVSAVIPQWGQGEGWHDCLSPLRRRHQRLSQLRTSWKCVRFWIRTKEFTFFPFQILQLER